MTSLIVTEYDEYLSDQYSYEHESHIDSSDSKPSELTDMVTTEYGLHLAREYCDMIDDLMETIS